MIDFILSRFNSFSTNTRGFSSTLLQNKIKKQLLYNTGSDTLVVAFPGWGQNLWTWKIVKRFVINRGNSFLIYEFPREILSDDVSLTRDCFGKIKETVLNDISELKEKHKFSRCVVVGVSLGTTLASMVYKNNSDISRMVFIASGNNLAKNLWSGCRTQHLRKSYEKQGISVEDLVRDWNTMLTENNLPFPKTQIFCHFGKQDQVILFKESSVLVDIFKKNQIYVKVSIHNLGHYFLILKFLLFPKRFLYTEKQV